MPEGSHDRATKNRRDRPRASTTRVVTGPRSTAVRLNAAGLALGAAGMVLQIASGSTLYPSLAGPVVLLGTAALVLFGPQRWAPYVGLVVPLVLGVGAIVASTMTGGLIGQLGDVGHVGILAGTLMHVVGLVAAVAGAVGTLRARTARTATATATAT